MRIRIGKTKIFYSMKHSLQGLSMITKRLNVLVNSNRLAHLGKKTLLF